MTNLCPDGLTYAKGCRCDACRARVMVYMRNWRRRKAEIQWGKTHPSDLVPMKPTRDCVVYARESLDLTYAEIARATGLTPQTVEDLYFGRRKRVTRKTEEGVLAVYGPRGTEDRDLVDRQLIEFEPHKWKLHALFAQGWTQRSLRDLLRANGYGGGWCDHTSTLNCFKYSSLKELDWLINHIGDRPGPSTRNPGRMAARGVFPLIHYTEEGKLIRASLLPEQREIYERVRSTHGPAPRRSRRDASRAGRGRGKRDRLLAS